MYDKLAHRMVMIGDDDKQELSDDQLYLTADARASHVTRIQFQIGPSLSEASDGVTVTVADLTLALAQFGLTFSDPATPIPTWNEAAEAWEI